MKKLLLGLLAASSLLYLSSPASAVSVADYGPGAAANGIAGSRHNLGQFGMVLHAVPVTGGKGTTEICVFCHTPHHTNTGLAPAPLWNRVNSATTYIAYGSTLGGTSITSVGGVSLACLSCHDGVTTFDTLVNAPGTGGINPAGASQGWTFAMPNNVVAAFFDPNTMTFTVNPLNHFGDPVCGNCHTSAYADRLNIGTGFGNYNAAPDLRNDHPVSVPYSNTVASLRPSSTVIASIDLTSGLTVTGTYAANIQQNRWAIKGYISDTASIDDLLKNGKVECSSCHDPHFKNMSWDETEPRTFKTWCGNSENCADGQFLRRVGGNTGSGVCRTCHNK